MALEFESVDAVPEAIRGEFAQGEDGKWRPKGYVPETEHAGLRKSQQRILEEKKKLQERYAEVNLEEVEALRKEKAEREREQAEKKGEFERLAQKLREESQAAMTKQLEQEKRLRSALHNALVRGEAIRAIGAEKGNADLLLPHVEALVEVIEDGGQFVPRIRDKEGGHRFGKGGAYMTIEELVKSELKERFPQAFEGANTAGGGAAGTRGAGGNEVHNLPPEQRLAWALSKKAA